MKDNKPWYEKISIWITIVASICAIFGISVFGNKSFIEDKNDEDILVDFEEDKQSIESAQLEYTQPEEKSDVLQNESDSLDNTSQQSEDQNNNEMIYQITSLQEINDQLEAEKTNMQNEIITLEGRVSTLENEVSDLENELNEYKNRFGIISVNNSKTVSIFTLDTFQGSVLWYNSSNTSDIKEFFEGNFVDTYGIEYPLANLAKHYYRNTKEENSITYLLDYAYTKCEGKIAWPRCDKNEPGNVWIEFYADDKCIYTTAPITASDRALSFEFSVEGVEKLTIVMGATKETSIIYIIYPYFNLVKY